MLIDRVGARVVLVVTAGICMIGQAVFAAGGFKNWFWLMLVGNAIDMQVVQYLVWAASH